MATIEISTQTYNSMLDRIKELEENEVSLSNKIKKQEIIINELTGDLQIVRSANWVDRVFGWKQILKLANIEKNSDEK